MDNNEQIIKALEDLKFLLRCSSNQVKAENSMVVIDEQLEIWGE